MSNHTKDINGQTIYPGDSVLFVRRQAMERAVVAEIVDDETILVNHHDQSERDHTFHVSANQVIMYNHAVHIGRVTQIGSSIRWESPIVKVMPIVNAWRNWLTKVCGREDGDVRASHFPVFSDDERHIGLTDVNPFCFGCGHQFPTYKFDTGEDDWKQQVTENNLHLYLLGDSADYETQEGLNDDLNTAIVCTECRDHLDATIPKYRPRHVMLNALFAIPNYQPAV